MLLAGGPRSRNYPANAYPYRAESHFLYFVGLSLPRAALWMEDGRSILWTERQGADDALWHGETPDFEVLRERTGVDEVRDIATLAEFLQAQRGAAIATLPATDPLARHWQIRNLRRLWSLEGFVALTDPHDEVLADAVIELRLRHDAVALEHIEQAVAGTAAAHLHGMALTRAGLSEARIRAVMEAELVARHLSPAYGSIVTVHGEVLHHARYDGELKDGDLVLADVGGEYEGWASDITRTWPVNGRFSATQRAWYEIVLQAQQDAIDAVRPGVRYREIHARACLTLTRGLVDEGVLRGDPEALVERGAHALLFPHGIGHLMGLDVHDMEDLGDRAGYAPGRGRSEQFGLGFLRLDRDLEAGMVVTIEPGLYRVPAILSDRDLAGPFIDDGTLDRARLDVFSDVRGIRIEDDVVCTAAGHRVLSHRIPKTVADVESAVGRAT